MTVGTIQNRDRWSRLLAQASFPNAGPGDSGERLPEASLSPTDGRKSNSTYARPGGAAATRSLRAHSRRLSRLPSRRQTGHSGESPARRRFSQSFAPPPLTNLRAPSRLGVGSARKRDPADVASICPRDVYLDIAVPVAGEGEFRTSRRPTRAPAALGKPAHNLARLDIGDPDLAGPRRRITLARGEGKPAAVGREIGIVRRSVDFIAILDIPERLAETKAFHRTA